MCGCTLRRWKIKVWEFWSFSLMNHNLNSTEPHRISIMSIFRVILSRVRDQQFFPFISHRCLNKKSHSTLSESPTGVDWKRISVSFFVTRSIANLLVSFSRFFFCLFKFQLRKRFIETFETWASVFVNISDISFVFSWALKFEFFNCSSSMMKFTFFFQLSVDQLGENGDSRRSL